MKDKKGEKARMDFFINIMYMARKTHKRHRRSRRSSKKMRIPGLNATVKNTASGVKQGFSSVFGFLKNGFGLALDTAKEGVKQGTKIISSKTKKHRRRRHRR
jgi:ribosomal protein L6P/L9E